MTENETINTLYYLLGHENAIDKGLIESENKLNSQEKEALQSMLKEYRQYRAIGTVEQLKTIFDGFWKLKDLCEEYEKYGLPEDYWKLNEICKEYSAIGTIEEFKALKEKNEPKKIVYVSNMGVKTPHCPNCDMELTMNMYQRKFCGCGQKLDWE